MNWNLLLIQAIMYLVERNGPQILDALGDLLVALIKSLTPEQTAKLISGEVTTHA